MGMNRSSKKGAARTRAYNKLRKEWLPGRRCEGAPFAEGWGIECKGGEGLDLTVQHKRGRIGELLLDTDHWAALCWPCHHHIDSTPEDGYASGLAERRGRSEEYYQDSDPGCHCGDHLDEDDICRTCDEEDT